MKIESTTRFDDVDRDLGYEYRGFNYVIRHQTDEFLVRTYDNEPGKATVLRPTAMSTSTNLRILFEFLQAELGASVVSLYKSEAGSYVDIDLDSSKFEK